MYSDQSITDKMLSRILARLNDAGTKPQGWTIERSRRRPADNSELPLINIRPLKENVSKIGNNPRTPSVERLLHLCVTVRCAGEDTDLDPIRNYVIDTVMSDPSVGGLAVEVEETEHDWDGDGAALVADYAEDNIIFAVRYQTARYTAVSK